MEVFLGKFDIIRLFKSQPVGDHTLKKRKSFDDNDRDDMQREQRNS